MCENLNGARSIDLQFLYIAKEVQRIHLFIGRLQSLGILSSRDSAIVMAQSELFDAECLARVAAELGDNEAAHSHQVTVAELTRQIHALENSKPEPCQ